MSSEKEVKLYFVRHGETHFNVEKRLQGFCDSPLTDNGIEQAKSVGIGLSDIEFKAVYASESQRVVDTLVCHWPSKHPHHLLTLLLEINTT
jgi:broad specificity phosphatase PhoE